MSQSRKLPSFLERSTLILSLILVGFLTFSCGSDDAVGGKSPDPKEKNIRLTLTINGVTPDDLLAFTAIGLDIANPHTATVWKVNGEVRFNETAMFLNQDFFIGTTKTYVIESVAPASHVVTGINFRTYDNRSYIFSYKAEVNGKVMTEENNVVVSGSKVHESNYRY